MKFQQIRTEFLSGEQMRECVPGIANFLTSAGHSRINVAYGWGCKLPMDELWRPAESDTLTLTTFAEQSICDRIFQFGIGDLHIEDADETLEFRLCHELDIHFASRDQNLVDRAIMLWRAEGLRLYGSSDPKESTRAMKWPQIE